MNYDSDMKTYVYDLPGYGFFIVVDEDFESAKNRVFEKIKQKYNKEFHESFCKRVNLVSFLDETSEVLQIK